MTLANILETRDATALLTCWLAQPEAFRAAILLHDGALALRWAAGVLQEYAARAAWSGDRVGQA